MSTGVEGFAASVVLIAVLLGVLLLVAFDVFCLVHLAAAGRARFLPKLVWAVLIVCVSPLGGLVYLQSQRWPRRSPDSYWLFSGRA
jgi:Phospholipase_D-nuclease N-terminal